MTRRIMGTVPITRHCSPGSARARGRCPEGDHDLVGVPPGTGLARREEYRAKRYHRPSDELDPAWELTGTAQLARIVELAIEEIGARGGKVPWRNGSPYRR